MVSFSFCQRARRADAFSLRFASSSSIRSSRSLEAGSFSFFRAWRSISSWSVRRSSSSSSSGRLSIWMRMREAASSTRSMALSGRNRLVM